MEEGQYKTNSEDEQDHLSAGQALFELLLVVALLVLILTAVVSLVVASLATVQKSRLRARAGTIAQDGMEGIRLKHSEYLGANDWETFRDSCGANKSSWAWDGVDTSGYTVDAICATPTPSGNKLIVGTEVEWEFGGKTYDLDIDSELGPREGQIYR